MPIKNKTTAIPAIKVILILEKITRGKNET